MEIHTPDGFNTWAFKRGLLYYFPVELLVNREVSAIATNYSQVMYADRSPEEQQMQFFMSMGMVDDHCKDHLEFNPHCAVCVKSKMRDSPAKKGAATKERPVECADVDCMISTDPDNNGTTVDMTMILPRTGWADVRAIASKESESTEGLFRKERYRVESATDPGGKLAYKIQRVQMDPGSEFRGKFERFLQDENLLLTRGGVAEKKAGSYVEGFQGTIHPLTSALAEQALINEDLAILLHGELRSHAADLKIHKPKKSGVSPFEEQTGQI